MKTFKIEIKDSTIYTKEIQAKDYTDALQQAKNIIWHGRLEECDGSYDGAEVSYVEEKV